MKNQKSISILVLVITIFSIIATSYAIYSNQGPGEYEYQSIFGETVSIYGKGLYKHDSVSMAAQAIAQDYVTLFLGVPLLVFSLYLSRKGRLKGHLLLTGTLGYFLYTYASYSFLSMYNPMFLVYVILMSASFFAFTLAMMSFEIAKLPLFFKEKLPVKLIGGFLLFASFVFGMMWLAKIVQPFINHSPTEGIEHYTTLVIQALDLGFVVPVGIVAGILLISAKAIWLSSCIRDHHQRYHLVNSSFSHDIPANSGGSGSEFNSCDSRSPPKYRCYLSHVFNLEKRK